ncbi:MAG TPA: hypothetical protein VJ521_03805, partial [Acidobacteriota bacterium]|nr:hypothetical protein [Acidobacteriota bacterium]
QKTTAEIQKKEAPPAEPRLQAMTFQIHPPLRKTKWTGEPISFDFKDIDIRDFFRFIAELTGLNMIIDPSVKGTLTMKMTEVPWDQVLDLVCRTHGLGYEIEGNVISVDR